MTTSNQSSDRARWMSVLGKAPAALLSEMVANFGDLPAYVWLRQPETGLAMVRARTGGTGGQFNLGEMSVTRCALRLTTGEMGVAYVAGRNTRQAEWAAIFDALMQSAASTDVQEKVIRPIEIALAAQRAKTHAQAQATKVDFMTLVRGEDA